MSINPRRVKKTQEMRALYRRAAAARDLADRGDLDGEVALSYVIWPTRAMEVSEVERPPLPDDQDVPLFETARA